MEPDPPPTARVAVEPASPTQRLPCLVVLAGPDRGRMLLLRKTEHIIGRGAQVDFPLVSQGVSRRHARICCRGDRVELHDLKSTNGSWCNGRAVVRQTLRDGDHLQMGECRLAFRMRLPEEDRLLRQLFRRATRDPLTGLLNRACLEDRIEREIRHQIRYRRGLGLVQLDLDHFKRINDTWGHPAGDRVLRAVAGAVRACLRGSDLAGRIGGEEFLVVLPEADLARAVRIAEKIRRAVAGLRLELGGRTIELTTSCGVTSAGGQAVALERLLEQVDQACYRAKRAGRNQVVVHADLPVKAASGT